MAPLNYAFECNLLYNKIYGYLFILIWFWLLTLAIFYIQKLVYWIYKTLSSDSSCKFVLTYLPDHIQPPPNNYKLMSFVKNVLSYNGITMLKIVANSNPDICMLIMGKLWQNYEENASLKQTSL
ncbi:hypothetical protein ACQ4LE_009001 [Meloidogyne hapla]